MKYKMGSDGISSSLIVGVGGGEILAIARVTSDHSERHLALLHRANTQPALLEALEELVTRCPFEPMTGGVRASINMAQIAQARAAIQAAKET